MDYKKLLENEKVQYIVKNIIDYQIMAFNGKIIEELSVIFELLDDIDNNRVDLDELSTLTTSFSEAGQYYKNWQYYKEVKDNRRLMSLIESIDYILNYAGSLNLNYFYNLQYVEEKKVIYLKNLILNDFYDPKIEKKKQ